jgi:hypothetical protein
MGQGTRGTDEGTRDTGEGTRDTPKVTRDHVIRHGTVSGWMERWSNSADACILGFCLYFYLYTRSLLPLFLLV